MNKARIIFPTIRAAMVPPANAIRELIATSPEIPFAVCADMTLKPNHPTVKIQAPKAKKEY